MTKYSPPNIPGYSIVRPIGEGGMSVVYLAMQDSLKRHVGLKLMRVSEQLTESMAERFIHEAETIAKLDHPNIVSIYDVGRTADGSLYYTMPFLDHGDLCSFAYEGQDRRLASLLQSLCTGLGYAHEHGVVHRDIKPENVLFDKFGTAQIADFGIALSADNRKWTKEDQVIGSVDYMSPEQCQAQVVGPQSDLYSLGIIIWELLTGKVPFEAEDEMGVMLAHVSSPLPDMPWELRHWLPLLQRCLAKNPVDRFRDADELRWALARVPPNTLGQTRVRLGVTVSNWFSRWRNRLALATGAAVLILAVLTAGYFWWQTRYPQEEKLEIAELPSVSPAQPTEEQASSEPLQDQSDLVVSEPPEPEVEPAISVSEALQRVEQADERISQDRLSRPKNDNAADLLVSVLEVYPDHPQAIDGVAALSARYRQFISEALSRAAYENAGQYADSMVRVWQRAGLPRTRFPLIGSALLDAVFVRINMEMDRFDPEGAEAALAVGRIIDPKAEKLEVMAKQIEQFPEPGQLLTDTRGVDTVFIPRQLKHPDGRSRSGAQGFAIMNHEVTVATYRRFAEQRGWPETSCRSRGEAPPLFRSRNWQQSGMEQDDNHPVVCISWHDAIAFAEWLSARSGHLYRLPTAREWLHAAWVGHEADSACQTGNVGGAEAAHFLETPMSCDDGVVFTSAVAQYQANRLGVFDLRGNVREWVDDCAPTETGLNKFLDRLNLKDADRCDRRTVRGTSWLDGSGVSMNQFSQHEGAGDVRSYIGFRVLRDLVAEREREQSND